MGGVGDGLVEEPREEILADEVVHKVIALSKRSDSCESKDGGRD
jgi:hypothetical protein